MFATSHPSSDCAANMNDEEVELIGEKRPSHCQHLKVGLEFCLNV